MTNNILFNNSQFGKFNNTRLLLQSPIRPFYFGPDNFACHCLQVDWTRSKKDQNRKAIDKKEIYAKWTRREKPHECPWFPARLILLFFCKPFIPQRTLSIEHWYSLRVQSYLRKEAENFERNAFKHRIQIPEAAELQTPFACSLPWGNAKMTSVERRQPISDEGKEIAWIWYWEEGVQTPSI